MNWIWLYSPQNLPLLFLSATHRTNWVPVQCTSVYFGASCDEVDTRIDHHIPSKFFSTASDATSFVNLVSFQPFQDTADAVSAATACIEGKVSKTLKSSLKKQMKNKSLKGIITYIMNYWKILPKLPQPVPTFVPCNWDFRTLYPGINWNSVLIKLIPWWFRLLDELDELDKEINTYAMRVKEWYGWHFPGE